MNEIKVKESTKIENLIYEIRGKQVMLDSDLAKLYGCKNGTKDINKAVKRNIERFPNDFYFQLTEKEFNNICSRFQIGTLNKSNNKRGYNLKYLPYVFTEAGVAMLSSVLRTEQAIKTSVKIIKAFIAMRHFIMDNKNILQSIVDIRSDVSNINNKLLVYDDNFNIIFNRLDKKEIEKNHVFYEGQIYDAYSLMMKILNKAKKEIIIIDNYVGRELFDLIKDVKVKVVVYTKNIDSEAIKNNTII